jgi:hypothetical protein
MSSARPLILALALGIAGCGDPLPEVEVSTHVGPSHARHDELQRREHARTVATTVLAGLVREEHAASDVPALPDAPVHPPADAAQFERLVEAVREVPLDEVGGPARRLAAAGKEVWPSRRKSIL